MAPEKNPSRYVTYFIHSYSVMSNISFLLIILSIISITTILFTFMFWHHVKRDPLFWYYTNKAPDVEKLISMLRHEDSWRCEQAAKALGALGDERAVDPLIATLATKTPVRQRVVMEAVRALSRMGDTKAIVPLQTLLLEIPETIDVGGMDYSYVGAGGWASWIENIVPNSDYTLVKDTIAALQQRKPKSRKSEQQAREELKKLSLLEDKSKLLIKTFLLMFGGEILGALTGLIWGAPLM
jgi:hypothetical protein